MKKSIVLIILFVFPIVVYLFFASGVTNFGKLPVLTENVTDVKNLDSSITFYNKISILGFLGTNLELQKGNLFNLNQKIYKRFYEFNDFQFIMVVPKGQENKVAELKQSLGSLGNTEKWNFVFGDGHEIQELFESLKTNITLSQDLSTPYVFIIDKDRSLRGRKDDEDEGMKYGFKTSAVAELNNKMEDDVKIILAEYRLALKKNTSRKNESE